MELNPTIYLNVTLFHSLTLFLTLTKLDRFGVGVNLAKLSANAQYLACRLQGWKGY